MLKPKQTALPIGIVSFFSISLAWKLPGSWQFAVLGWVFVCSIQSYIRNPRTGFIQYLILAILAHSFSYSWIPPSVQQMSGMGLWGTYIFSFLFHLLGGLQFLLFLLIFRSLPVYLEKSALRSALAWVSVEVLPLRIFPWIMGHTQSEFLSFIQIAEFAGATGVSFIMFWLAESLYLYFFGYKKRYVCVLPLSVFLISCLFGIHQINYFSHAQGKKLEIALVQAGENKADKDPSVKYEKYKALTDKLSMPLDLVVWPENTIPEIINESVMNLKNAPSLPVFSKSINLLTGAKTYRRPNKKFNSAMLIKSDGSIPLPYHKQVLIPFGEYIPYEEIFPWLRFVNPKIEKTESGTDSKLFEIKDSSKKEIFKIAPLICYEDIIPEVSRKASNDGADMLIVLSNDSWLPKNEIIALRQHFALALFRSIENRKPLARATETGVTAIVDVTGRIVSELAPYTDDIIKKSVLIYDYKTIFTKFSVDKLWKFVSALTFVLLVINLFKRSRKI